MIFIDTGAFCAFSDRRDSCHAIAVAQFSKILKARQSLVTTNFVVDETYTWLRYRLGSQPALAFLKKIHEAEQYHEHRLEVVTVTRSLEDQACRLLGKFTDQDLSYTDATSFALIKERRISTAFTFDHHFYILPIELIPGPPGRGKR